MKNRIVKTIMISALGVFALPIISHAQTTELLAFPTAEGFGKFAKGGRGGHVVAVTTLEDYSESGTAIEGSFRWATKQFPNQPITIVFRVSGTINLVENLRSGRSNWTIAGQTAPGEGICFRGGKLNFGGAQDLVIRHIRSRIGLSDDGEFLNGGSIGIENGKNIIIDHCTFGWSSEENMTFYDNPYTTVQWCVLHEALYAGGHGKGARGYGSQWGGAPATYHHNLLAHHVSRSCRFNGASNPNQDRIVFIEYANNVNYNWGKRNSCYGAEREAGTKSIHECNFLNNYYKPGPATPSGSYFFEQSAARSGKTSAGPSHWYLSGNVMGGSSSATTDNWSAVNNRSIYPIADLRVDTLIMPVAYDYPKYKVNLESAEDAFNSVLEKAGALPRDIVDTRIIEETRTGTAGFTGGIYGSPGIIDKPTDVEGYISYIEALPYDDADGDGMDDAWELLNGLDPTNPEDRNQIVSNGYTALDAFLAYMAGERIEISTSIGKTQVKSVVRLQPTAIEDLLHIDTPDSPVARVVINSIDGRTVKVQTTDVSSGINCSNFKTGYYLVNIELANRTKHNFKVYKK